MLHIGFLDYLDPFMTVFATGERAGIVSDLNLPTERLCRDGLP